MPGQDQEPPSHHLLIAGTGRAGTSFLVRWLAAAGLRTHLATHETPMWDETANAGLEDMPVVADWQDAPYVVKSPWLVEVIDDVLANPLIVLDGVIVPVRDLEEAAASRIVQERQTAHRRHPWMSSLTRGFEQWGTTPGGVVYSLDPVDQARLLAVSFHRLVQRLVKADIPVVLLDFPRLALDADYLFDKLRRFVPATLEEGRAAHAEIADPDKIRVGRELAALQPSPAPPPPARPMPCSIRWHCGGKSAGWRTPWRRQSMPPRRGNATLPRCAPSWTTRRLSWPVLTRSNRHAPRSQRRARDGPPRGRRSARSRPRRQERTGRRCRGGVVKAHCRPRRMLLGRGPRGSRPAGTKRQQKSDYRDTQPNGDLTP